MFMLNDNLHKYLLLFLSIKSRCLSPEVTILNLHMCMLQENNRFFNCCHMLH